MASPPRRVAVILDKTQDLANALYELTANSVFVGIPSTRVTRQPVPGEPDPPNNAVIGYVQENGDPAKNIPPRPFLVPAIKAIQPEIRKRLKEIGKTALEADIGKMQRLRGQLGIYAARAVQQKITDGPFVPLSEVTLKARANRTMAKTGAGSRKGALKELARRAQGLPASTDFARPLIDTGQLRRAITYVIGPNRNRKAVVSKTGGFLTFLDDGKKK